MNANLFEVELVGGPHDGDTVLSLPGELFIYFTETDGEHVYGLGDDGKYHYCPEMILGDEVQS